MKKMLALEELAQMAGCFYALSQLNISFNYYLLVPAFFLPDLYAIGYLINNKAGAAMYNFSHHKLVALLLVLIGIVLSHEWTVAAGIIAYAHSSFDRMIGYGLKYMDSPSHTHLGFIGKEKFKNEKDHF